LTSVQIWFAEATDPPLLSEKTRKNQRKFCQKQGRKHSEKLIGRAEVHIKRKPESFADLFSFESISAQKSQKRSGICETHLRFSMARYSNSNVKNFLYASCVERPDSGLVMLEISGDIGPMMH
jgi:hypothetical protein